MHIHVWEVLLKSWAPHRCWEWVSGVPRYGGHQGPAVSNLIDPMCMQILQVSLLTVMENRAGSPALMKSCCPLPLHPQQAFAQTVSPSGLWLALSNFWKSSSCPNSSPTGQFPFSCGNFKLTDFFFHIANIRAFPKPLILLIPILQVRKTEAESTGLHCSRSHS